MHISEYSDISRSMFSLGGLSRTLDDILFRGDSTDDSAAQHIPVLAGGAELRFTGMLLRFNLKCSYVMFAPNGSDHCRLTSHITLHTEFDLAALLQSPLLMAVPKRRTTWRKARLRMRNKWLHPVQHIASCPVCGRHHDDVMR